MNRRSLIKTASATTALLVMPKAAFAQTPSATPDTTQGTLAGNAHDLVSKGTTTDVEIVSFGGVVDRYVQVIIRNNSDHVVSISDVVGVTRGAAGTLTGTTSSSEVVPYIVQAGGIAIASVYFDDVLDPSATFEFDLELERPSESHQDLMITEVAPSPSGILGIATNMSEVTVTGPNMVLAVYLDDTGTPTGFAFTYAEKDQVEPGKTTPFSATAYGTVTDNYLIGAMGWTI